MEVLLSSEGLIALFTLATLEIVLGVDNLVFISIAVGDLPPERRSSARRFGLLLACISRLGLLLSLSWLAGMTMTVWSIDRLHLSVRDLVLIFGGLFLVIKGIKEIVEALGDGEGQTKAPAATGSRLFALVIAQIAVIDIVFSLDSVITAVGLVNEVSIMATAIIIAVALMIWFSDTVGEFIDHNPTIKMLALAFIVLVGVALLADGLHHEIPRGYLYFAMFFSGAVESLNLVARRRRNGRREDPPDRRQEPLEDGSK
ncbi:MAG: TerC family protein [Lysobacterales bacterium]